MTADWLDRGQAHVWRPYCQHATAPAPLPVVGAHGCRLHLADGRQLVDGTASWWTAAHGYNHPHLRARMQAQLEQLPHVAFGGLAHEAGYSLAARLAALLPDPLRHVFFTESGSVAVEVALKMAMQAQANRGSARRGVLAFAGAYHGDTFATMSLCDPHDGMHHAFRGLGVPVEHLPVPRDGDDFEARFAALAPSLACVIIEPLVQCAGGMRMHSVSVLHRLRAVCDAHDVLLVFDEIATGFYRVGRRFALEEAGVVPDVVVVGKALTGGSLPLAAAIASEEVFSAFHHADASRALQHGPTYMANAVACAAAHGSLDLFERDDYGAHAAKLEGWLRATLEPLRDAAGVRAVNVRGAVGALVMQPGSAPSSDRFAAHGAFVRPLRLRAADVVYLMPPLLLPDADAEVLAAAVHACLG